MEAVLTNHVVVLCAECKNVPIEATPRIGNAKTWDGLLICTPCGEKLGTAMRKAWKEMVPEAVP